MQLSAPGALGERTICPAAVCMRSSIHNARAFEYIAARRAATRGAFSRALQRVQAGTERRRGRLMLQAACNVRALAYIAAPCSGCKQGLNDDAVG